MTVVELVGVGGAASGVGVPAEVHFSEDVEGGSAGANGSSVPETCSALGVVLFLFWSAVADRRDCVLEIRELRPRPSRRCSFVMIGLILQYRGALSCEFVVVPRETNRGELIRKERNLGRLIFPRMKPGQLIYRSDVWGIDIALGASSRFPLIVTCGGGGRAALAKCRG